MVIFHLIYDLHLFNFKFIPRSFSPFWIYFPRLIVFLFLLAVGMSIGVSTKSPSFVNYIKSQKKLFAACLIVSLTTYFVFPSRWIYFGTLHCIFACKVLLFPLRRLKYLSLLLFLVIQIPIWAFEFKYPWFTLPHQSMDYIPVFPWISVCFLGIFLAKTQLVTKGLADLKLPDVLQLTTKNSLEIYLIHQPVLYALVWMLHHIKSS